MADAAQIEYGAALPYMAAAAWAFAMGTGILLYERFSSASRRFAVVSWLVAGWLSALAAGRLADGALAASMFQTTTGLQALSVAAVYGLAVSLSGVARGARVVAGWALGVGWFVLSLVGPVVPSGLTAVAGGAPFSPGGAIGLAYIGFIAGMLALAIRELLLGYRRSAFITDRHRHLLMLVALGVGGMSVADLFFYPPSPGAVGASVVAVPLAILLMGFAQIRYRAFSEDAPFAEEQVLRALGDAVLVCDEAGAIRIINPEASRLLGEPRGGILGRPISEVIVGPEPGGAAQPLGSGRLRDVELHLVRRDAPPIPVSVSAEPLSGRNMPRGYVVVARDIRDRLATRRVLEETELRYRSLFWHNPGIAYEIAPDGVLVHANPAAEALLDAPAGGLVGKSLADVMAPEELPATVRLFEAVLAGEAQEYELDVVSLKGARRTIRGVSIPIRVEGRVTGVFGVALDVTAEARAKRDMEVQRRYFAELFEGSPEAIALINEAGVIRRVNGEFSRLFGYTKEEAVGRKLDDLIVPEDQREMADRLGRMAVEGRLMRMDLVRRRKEGGLVDVSLLARRFQAPGEELQVYAIYRDVTEQKRTEEQLRSREEELRHAQRLEAVGKLAGGIAHDFNNLLTVINGHTRFVLEELSPDERVQADLEEIERAGVRAASLTQQLLAFSRRQVLRPEAVDLNEVVREMERMLQRLIGTHIRLDTELAAALPPILVDRGQVEQVIMNLAVNARDAMPGGGVLIIRTSTVRFEEGDPALDQWEVEPGRYVHMEVEDSGTGMSPEVLARVFDPFFTTKERGKGTGLGLATVFGIVKQSGGHIMARSEPGEGSWFGVYLPTARVSTDRRADEDTPSVGVDHEPTGTVLVAEDEPSVRSLAVRILGRQGYEVLDAPNGAVALEVAQAYDGRIHVLVTDLMMPEMGGRELARRFREDYPDTAILFMSGYDDEMSMADIATDAFLSKPFTPGQLVELVAGLLGARRS